jgi:hypothetical protein
MVTPEEFRNAKDFMIDMRHAYWTADNLCDILYSNLKIPKTLRERAKALCEDITELRKRADDNWAEVQKRCLTPTEQSDIKSTP